MAYGSRPTSSGRAQTCQIRPPSLETIRLSTTVSGQACPQACDYPFPTSSNTAEIGQAVNEESTRAAWFPPKPQDELVNSTPDGQYYDQNLGSETYALIAMPEPHSFESFREPDNNDTTPNTHSQPASFLSPPQRLSRALAETGVPLQDSSYFSKPDDSDEDGSMVGVDGQTRQMRARERVVILRGRVLRTRRVLRNCRDELRQLRENVRDATDKLMRKVNEISAFNIIREDLAPYHERLCLAQDALGPVEDTYDRLESRLDEEEQDFEQEEDHFYRHYDVSTTSISDSKLDDEISPLVRTYHLGDDEIPGFSLENKLEEYFQKIAQAGHLKEQLDMLEEDYYRFSTDASFRDRYDIPLSAETTSFLTEYPTRHAEVHENLHETECEIWHLRSQCIGEGLFNEEDYLYEPRDALCEEVMDAVYEAQDRSPFRMSAYHVDRQDNNMHYEDKRAYVNSWLLQWIQDSTYDCLVLKAWVYFKYPDRPAKDQELANNKWSDLVLEMWDTDSAGDQANENFDANMLDAIAGDTGRFNETIIGKSGVSSSLRSLDVDLGDVERAEGITEENTIDSEAAYRSEAWPDSASMPDQEIPSWS